MRLQRNFIQRTQAALALVACLSLIGCGDAGSVGGPAADVQASKGLSIEKEDGRINIMSGGDLVTALNYAKSWDKPFLYPLKSTSGTVISRGFPLETKAGESTDHPWHRGIWYGHGDVTGEDFWRELAPDKSGKLVVQGEPEATATGNSATIRFTVAMQGREPDKKRYGSIDETYVLTREGEKLVVDTTITVNADAGIDLKFADSDDGGLGFRLSDAYREDRDAQLINSNGLSGSKAMWGKPANWVDYSAKVDGKTIGFAMFDHPSNVRHPTGWHARGYALCAANPFALGSFAEDKSIDGSYTVKSGEKLTLQYRVVIHEGAFQPADVESWYSAWTAGK